MCRTAARPERSRAEVVRAEAPNTAFAFSVGDLVTTREAQETAAIMRRTALPMVIVERKLAAVYGVRPADNESADVQYLAEDALVAQPEKPVSRE